MRPLNLILWELFQSFKATYFYILYFIIYFIKEKHNRFDPTKSITFRNKTVNFGIEYGDGSNVTGYLVEDSLSIAGLNIKKQLFGLVTRQCIYKNFICMINIFYSNMHTYTGIIIPQINLTISLFI